MTCTIIGKFDPTICNAETFQNRSLNVHELWEQCRTQIFFDFLVLLIAKIMCIISINNHDNIYELLNFLVSSNSFKVLI